MVKKKDNKFLIFIVIACAIVLIWVFNSSSEDNSKPGEKTLKEKYEVLEYFCTDSRAGIDMKSLGSREDQFIRGFISLYEDCPNSEDYSIKILEPTKECLYHFNREIIRLWNNHLEQGSYTIPESSKNIIKSDVRFFIWESQARLSYEAELRDGTSGMTSRERGLSLAYKDYLEEGFTMATLLSMFYSELNDPTNCG